MGNGWFLVKVSSDAMTDELTNNTESATFCFGANCGAYRRDWTVRRDGVDSEPQAIESTLSDGFGFVRDFTDEEGFRLITMPAIDHARHVNVDNVAIL